MMNKNRINIIFEILLQYTQKNFSESIPISEKGDELDAIATGLNTMAEELQSHIQQVKESEEKFSKMFESSPVGVSIGVLPEGILIDVNKSFLQMFGFNKEEVIGRTSLDLKMIDTEEREKIRQELFQKGKVKDKEVLVNKKDGTKFPILLSIDNFTVGEKQYAITISYDISDRKKAEESQSEKKLRSSLDSMLEGVQIIGYDWKYLYVNDTVAKQGKYAKEELLGCTMMEKYPGIEKTELFKHLQRCLTERIPHQMENKFTYPDGSNNWFELSIQPVPEGVLILSINITENKKAEEEIIKLNTELEKKVVERTEQLQSVNKELEAFTYSVSHDLRAPLRAVDGYANIIEQDYSPVLDEEGKRLLTVVQYNAKKMGALIDDLLAFSRLGRQELQKTTINMNELAEAVLFDLNKAITHNTEIKIGKLHSAKADYALISQVFANLISNGIKYSSKKKKPVVEMNSEYKNEQIIYSVKDNGAGFDMKYVHKLFGVFQRLHTLDEFEGTGVGLAIVQRIVNKHGGKVWAEAKPDEGATFYFSLPEK